MSVQDAPTAGQQSALETLRYAAPLLRLLRCEVVYAQITVDARLTQGGTLTLGDGGSPIGVRRSPVGVKNLLSHALWSLVPPGWLIVPDSVVTVTYRPASGLVAVHHPDGRVHPWRVDRGHEHPLFARDLGPLLLGTLDSGGAGVLADWIDDHTGELSAVTAGLRDCVPYTHDRSAQVGRFRYVQLGTDAVCWAFLTGRIMGHLYSKMAAGAFGFGLFGPDGLTREWYFTLPPPAALTFRERVWATFPAPREVEP